MSDTPTEPLLTMEQIEAEHAAMRAEDQRRLAAGEVTPTQLRHENNFFYEAHLNIDLLKHIKRVYGG